MVYCSKCCQKRFMEEWGMDLAYTKGGQMKKQGKMREQNASQRKEHWI